MEYRELGKTGLRISRVGLGGIPIQRIDAAGTGELVRGLMDAGVNYVDTARGYTVSEEYLGEALEGVRDRWVVATKSMARTREEMARDIEISLKNLRTGYIDLYQVHNPTVAQLEQVAAPGGALAALQEARAAGKIGHIGVTAHSTAVFELALRMDWVETIMFPYNIVETQGEALMRAAAAQGVGFIAMKPLAGGAIEDAALAMRFLAAQPEVDVIIPGMADLREAEVNLTAAADTAPLTAEEQAAMERIRRQFGTRFCRRCNYCAPCTAGISIPAVFLMQGYLTRYGLGDWARARYAAMPAKASACVECGVCETRCPYELPIRQMLKQAAEQFGE